MSLRLHPTDPESMAPEDRHDDVASIFAGGFLCLHAL
jgi:hypothetical protein